jgi:Leishmanolysin
LPVSTLFGGKMSLDVYKLVLRIQNMTLKTILFSILITMISSCNNQKIDAGTTGTPNTQQSDFLFSITTNDSSVLQGSFETLEVKLIPSSERSAPVKLELENAPAGLFAKFNPVDASPNDFELTLNAAKETIPGLYALKIKGTIGSSSATTTFNLRILAGQATSPIGTIGNGGTPQPGNDTTIINPPSTTGFNITLRINGKLSATQQQTFVLAAQRWSTIITKSIGPLTGTSIPARSCGGNFPAFRGSISNVLIDLRIAPIDGPGKILGQAGPCLIRDDNHLTYYGIMEFDSADVAELEAANTFQLVILHEMGHVLGFGSLWREGRTLVTGTLQGSACGSNPRFIGPQAIREWKLLGGTGEGVPVENTGGAGTCESHWRESILGNELMTGFLNATANNPLSRLTIAAMADLGYSVSIDAADAYALPNAAQLRSLSAQQPFGQIVPIRPEQSR